MNRIFALASVSALALGVVATASAQTKPAGVSFRAGIFFPSNGDAKSVRGGKQWFAAGLEYKLGDLKVGAENPNYSSSYSVSVDWTGKDDFRNIPVLVNYVGRTSQGFYYKAGAGIGFVQYYDFSPSQLKTRHNTAFAYQAALGYDLKIGPLPSFIEVAYLGSSKSVVNGIGVYGGVRF